MRKEDNKLIKEYLQGNQQAFYIISNWIRTVVQNEYWGLRDQWPDIIQDVRMKLYLNLDKQNFQQKSNF